MRRHKRRVCERRLYFVFLLSPKALPPGLLLFIPSYWKKLTGQIIQLTNNQPGEIILVSERYS